MFWWDVTELCAFLVLVFVDEIKKLFPGLFGQPSAALVPGETEIAPQSLKVGVVLSGGQAPGGHNVISGIYGKIAFFLHEKRHLWLDP